MTQVKEDFKKEKCMKEEFKREIVKANLAILKNQLDPHFVFNLMGSIKMMVVKQEIEADFIAGEDWRKSNFC